MCPLPDDKDIPRGRILTLSSHNVQKYCARARMTSNGTSADNCRWTQLDINDIVRHTTHVEQRRSCVCSKRCYVRLRGARGTGRLPQDNACPRQGPAMR